MFANTLKCAKYAALTLLCCSVSAWAQMTPQQYQQHQNDIGMYYQQQNSQKQQQNAAARRRAWEARERKVKAEIAELRATPFYMAIVFHVADKSFSWAGGYVTKQRAVEMAMRSCQNSDCQVALIFHNACAVMTFPLGSKELKDTFFGIHPDDKQAAEISIKKCEAVHGKGNCAYSAMKTRNGTAFCTGYDYGFYGYK